MEVFQKKDKKRTAIEKELAILKKKEIQLAQSARKAAPPRWKAELEKKIPEKVCHSLEAALTKGAAYAEKDAEVERLLKAAEQPGEAELQAQIQKTGSAFAVDMLLLKLVQALLAGGHPLRGNELKTMNAELLNLIGRSIT